MSRVVNAPAGAIHQAWDDAARRREWMGTVEFTVSSTWKDKSVRGTWPDGSKFEVTLYPEGDGRRHVTVEQRKLSEVIAAAERKTFWAEQLDALKRTLEGT